MADSTPYHRLEIPLGTRQKLDGFRRRVWTIKLIEGLSAAAFGLLLSYLIVFLLDRFMDTPAWLRATLLIAGTTGFGLWLPIKCHRWIWKTRHFDQLARLLKQRMPRLSDRMLGIIELAQNDLEQQRSAVLCQAALRQVDEDIRNQSFDDAVPSPRHRIWACVAAVPTTVFLLALIAVPAAGTNALSRWLLPWKQIDRYTFAQLDQLPEQLVVPYSEEFSLTAPLAEETAWAPNKAVARIGEQPAVEAIRQDNAYAFALPPQQADGKLLVAAGDARKTITVEPKLRPEITELVAQVKLPEYLQYSSELSKDARSGSLSLVKGSEAMLVATASRELRSAMLNGAPQQIEATRIQTHRTLLNDSEILELSWTDKFGLTAKQPFKLSIQAHEDAPPSVVCSQLARQQVVLVDQVLTFEINADDDFGLKQIGLEWTGVEDPLLNPHPVSGEMLIRGGDPEATELTAKATFCASREGIPPQTLQLRIFTVDYYPNRERVYSPPYTLFVLSSEDHANWLTEQMRRWSRQAQEVYERENQLYETNKELRQLSPAELDAPKNRQRLETQAAAEATNARRLTAVSAAGKQIIKEAARNDQFNVMTMEGLAQMVKTLDEMAAKRMPSVADLLKKAATARTSGADPQQGDSSDSPPGDSQPSAPQVGNNRDPNNSSPGNSGEPSDDAKSAKPVPSISDIESSMNKPDDEDQKENEQGGKQQGGSPKFGLPSTTVLGGGLPQQQDQQDEPTVEENLDEAIAEQEDLLDEFAKVAEELQKILDNLEGSTFVKRLKATSRRHLKLAGDLNQTLSANFGRRPNQLTPEQREATVKLAEQERLEGENVMTIKQDLEAYYNRVQQGKFKTVINEMDELTVVAKLETLAELVSDNLHGQSIAHAEYWADTLDRWAEQLVGPGDPSGGSAPGSKGGSLSPAIVLDVMKILEKEIGLREETRSAEQMRDALDVEAYTDRANGLANTQHEIADMTAKTTMAIVDLEKEKNLSFPKELQLLNVVSSIMHEAEAILSEPNTGPEAIAAETEIIELLLQVQRQQPPKKSSKGAAGENPNGGGEGDTEESALALIGRGDEQNAGTVERETAQATGASGTAYPAEFRAGLDAYFADLEK